MDALSVTTKGQVTIPKHVRQKLGIRAGTRVAFRLRDDHVELVVVDAPVAGAVSGAGMLRRTRPAVPADFDVASLMASGD